MVDGSKPFSRDDRFFIDKKAVVAGKGL